MTLSDIMIKKDPDGHYRTSVRENYGSTWIKEFATDMEMIAEQCFPVSNIQERIHRGVHDRGEPEIQDRKTMQEYEICHQNRGDE